MLNRDATKQSRLILFNLTEGQRYGASRRSHLQGGLQTSSKNVLQTRVRTLHNEAPSSALSVIT